MIFDNKKRFMLFINGLKNIGMGSQGICYLDEKSNKVYKVFHQFFDDDEEFYVEYTKEKFLRFTNIVNDTFIWPEDVIMINDEVIGYISEYKNANSLYQINPLTVDLNNFISSVNEVNGDLRIISDNGVRSYDVMYNILYNKDGIFVIDHDEYSYSTEDSDKLFSVNCDNFNYGIMYFLIDGYFDDFISSHKYLKEMYDNKGININEFMILFKKYISEYIGKEVNKLGEASRCFNKKKLSKVKYQRILF